MEMFEKASQMPRQLLQLKNRSCSLVNRFPQAFSVFAILALNPSWSESLHRKLCLFQFQDSAIPEVLPSDNNILLCGTLRRFRLSH